jgi:hypothetical protein
MLLLSSGGCYLGWIKEWAECSGALAFSRLLLVVCSQEELGPRPLILWKSNGQSPFFFMYGRWNGFFLFGDSF